MLCVNIPDLLFQRLSEKMTELGPFEEAPTLGVAVSGGSDSLALVFLLHKWVKTQGGSLHAFHVDHQLRPFSHQEALQVKSWLSHHNISCDLLTWDHSEKPLTHIQEKARKARYALLEKACDHYGIFHLATAHHSEDQQETFRLREQSHSTEYGLAGMSAVSYFRHCRLIRPVLSFTKEELRTILGQHPYIEDPSNENPRFMRTHLRQHPLPAVDLSFYQKKRQHEEKRSAQFLATYSEIASEGYGKIPLTALSCTNRETLKRSLGFLVRCIGNTDYFPKPENIEKLVQKWGSKDYTPASLGKCVVYTQKEHVWIVPDRRLLIPVYSNPSGKKIWDRFIIQGSIPKGIMVAPLGQNGWTQIKARISPLIPCSAALHFPTYWQHKKVVAVPFLNFSDSSINCPSFVYKPKNSLLAEFFV